MHIVGADVGGTFTDIVLTDTDSGHSTVHKVPSTPTNPAEAVLRGIREICERENIALAALGHILHGTTVATNAVIEHKGVDAGMITSEGYRDIIHIGRHQRPNHYSIMQDIPWQAHPLVPRRSRLTVAERLIPPGGEVQVPLDEEMVRQAARSLADNGAQSIAICFLFSYLNPRHEQRAKEIVAECCPDIFVTTSHEVSAQFREFERFTTAAMNAYIGPLVAGYIENITTELTAAGIEGELHIMRSNGGIASAETVRQLPVYTLMSGLAAGVLGGAWVAKQSNRSNVITLDIGGTSADIGVVTNGKFEHASARETFVGGYPILVPMLDLHTLGAGGGSIAYLDNAGAFCVGPQSAGAEPGPAAYGRGGTQPTATDANLVLGRIDPMRFLGGDMHLDLGAAEIAIGKLADKLGMGPFETAEGVIAILNANMGNAIKARTIQKGIDPRDYSLLAAGGAGPLHAAEVARLLGVSEVIVPPYPGINSAVGLLTTDLRYDAVQTALMRSDLLDTDLLTQRYNEMENNLIQQLQSDGIAPEDYQLSRSASVRYLGQGYELRVTIANGKLDEQSVTQSLQAFHQLHQNEYGRAFPDSPIELVNLEVIGIGKMPGIRSLAVRNDESRELNVIAHKQVYFRMDNKLQPYQTQFIDRASIPLNTQFEGPAVILQSDSTTLVPPEFTFGADAGGNLILKSH